MANQFTDQLLELDINTGSSITEAGLLMKHQNLYVKEVDHFINGHVWQLSELNNFKATLICLLAAMSDEDLKEMHLTNVDR